jgi:hypothetical protein
MTTTPDPIDDVLLLGIDPYDHDVLREPYRFNERLREAGPLVWLSRYGLYACGRYDQVSAGLKQPRDLISSAGVGLADIRQGKSFARQVS